MDEGSGSTPEQNPGPAIGRVNTVDEAPDHSGWSLHSILLGFLFLLLMIGAMALILSNVFRAGGGA